MPITRDQAGHLAGLVHALRPSWNTAGILAVLKECQHRPEPAEVIAQAMLRCTMDRTEARTPAALIARPSYWNLTTPLEYVRERLTPEHECPDHIGEWKGTCGPCHGVAKAVPEPPIDLRPPEAYDPASGGTGLRDLLIREARANIAPPPVPRDTRELVHVVTDVRRPHPSNDVDTDDTETEEA